MDTYDTVDESDLNAALDGLDDLALGDAVGDVVGVPVVAAAGAGTTATPATSAASAYDDYATYLPTAPATAAAAGAGTGAPAPEQTRVPAIAASAFR